jgi:aspartate racemase
MKKIIGILGGMGPGATADAFLKLIKNTPAKKDQEHIPVIMISMPNIPDRTDSILHNGPSPLPEMMKSLKILESSGATCIVMPCNTAHYWYELLKESTSLDFISIIDSACENIINDGATSVGVLATTATIETGLYQKRLGELGVKTYIPDAINQIEVMKSIREYKSGDFVSAVDTLIPVIKLMESKGIEKFVMGCTEIPLILSSMAEKSPEKFIDATDALIKKAIKWYYAQ